MYFMAIRMNDAVERSLAERCRRMRLRHCLEVDAKVRDINADVAAIKAAVL